MKKWACISIMGFGLGLTVGSMAMIKFASYQRMDSIGMLIIGVEITFFSIGALWYIQED